MVMVIIQIAFGGINIATNDGMSVKIMVACRFHGSPCSNSRMLKTRSLAILTRLNQRMTRGVRTREHSSDSCLSMFSIFNFNGVACLLNISLLLPLLSCMRNRSDRRRAATPTLRTHVVRAEVQPLHGYCNDRHRKRLLLYGVFLSLPPPVYRTPRPRTIQHGDRWNWRTSLVV